MMKTLLTAALALAATRAEAATRTTVHFTVDGATVVGTMFRPANVPADQPLPVVLIDGPWTQVKEQVGYAYAPRLAAQGFAVLTIDHRNFGESGGEPREFESPALKVEDLRQAVGFLRSNPGIDANRIYGLGVCYGASLMADLARTEPNLKGLATVAAWLHDEASLKATFGDDGYAKRDGEGQKALDAYKRTGEVAYIPAFSNDTFAAMAGPFDYYSSTQRGVVPQWSPRFATMSFPAWLRHEAATYGGEVKQPVLMIHSNGSALPDNVRRFYAALPNARKQLVWTTGDHVDFYDHAELIDPAVTQVANFFHSL
jgi:fermentation-respiration switch protein FrsA (DUF1100 family)